MIKNKDMENMNKEYDLLVSRYDDAMRFVRGHKTVHLCDVLKDNFIYTGDKVRFDKDERFLKTKYVYLGRNNITSFGLDLHSVKTVSGNCFERLSATEVWKDNVIVSLENTRTKIALALHNIPNSCMSDNLLLLKVKTISPYYIALYLQTIFGQVQLRKCFNGANRNYIDITLAKHIVIPVLNEALIGDFDEEYKYILSVYEKALKCKENGDISEYNKLSSRCEHSMRYLIGCLEDNIERRW